jgi:transcriptional regulator with XRE-family HTH domain
MPAGQKLKALRNNRNITVREVERASRRIAAAKSDKRFRISNGWLAQLEKGVSEPGICKIFSLSVIYQVQFFDLIRLYDVDINEIEKYAPVANPTLTQLLSQDIGNHDRLAAVIPISGRSPTRTSLVPGIPGAGGIAPFSPGENGPGSLTYAYIGSNDFTMYPLIRPGSLVEIDTDQNKLKLIAWHNEFERPIYFMELRDGYTCGWCELHGNQLLVIPHHLSPASIRRFTYPREAEIVGRVTGYNTYCIDPEPESLEAAKEQKAMSAKSIPK